MCVESIGYSLLSAIPPERTGRKDSSLVLAPEVRSALPVTYSWSIDGQTVSADSVLAFPTDEAGLFEVSFSAENRDGRDEIEFTVEVMSPEDAFSWTFDRTDYGISSGRSLLLLYTWSVDGTEVQSGESSEYVFDLTAEGFYTVSVTMRNSYTTASQDLTVIVLPAEGTYFRPAVGSSSPLISQVYEYTPAPGQFINEGYTAATSAEACDYAFQRLSEGQFVSLGAFGGYITVGFDHSVESSTDGGFDLQITGNAHSSSSEPGIIWVSQDENGNGLPDDTWYELRGSEYGKPETWQDYAVTYGDLAGLCRHLLPAFLQRDEYRMDGQQGQLRLRGLYPRIPQSGDLFPALDYS